MIQILQPARAAQVVKSEHWVDKAMHLTFLASLALLCASLFCHYVSHLHEWLSLRNGDIWVDKARYLTFLPSVSPSCLQLSVLTVHIPLARAAHVVNSRYLTFAAFFSNCPCPTRTSGSGREVGTSGWIKPDIDLTFLPYLTPLCTFLFCRFSTRMSGSIRL